MTACLYYSMLQIFCISGDVHLLNLVPEHKVCIESKCYKKAALFYYPQAQIVNVIVPDGVWIGGFE